MNNDSEELVKDAVKDPGRILNLMEMKTQLIRKRTILDKNNITPMIRNHSDLYGTG